VGSTRTYSIGGKGQCRGRSRVGERRGRRRLTSAITAIAAIAIRGRLGRRGRGLGRGCDVRGGVGGARARQITIRHHSFSGVFLMGRWGGVGGKEKIGTGGTAIMKMGVQVLCVSSDLNERLNTGVCSRLQKNAPFCVCCASPKDNQSLNVAVGSLGHLAGQRSTASPITRTHHARSDLSVRSPGLDSPSLARVATATHWQPGNEPPNPYQPLTLC
jgi:hypothetical protein